MMHATSARPVHGLFVFLGRFELQSRAYFRSHQPGSAQAGCGPEAIRRDLQQMREHQVPLGDQGDEAAFRDQVDPPIARPAQPSSQDGDGRTRPQSADGSAKTRPWFRFASKVGRGRI